MIGYYNRICLRRAIKFFRDNTELVSYSDIERIADEQFLGEDPEIRHNKRHVNIFKKVYVANVILPYVEQKLKENPEKKFTLAEIISEFNIPSDWKSNLTNYLHPHIKQRDNDLIMIQSVHGMRLMLYQYNKECADAMRNGRSQGKWLCYEDMCDNHNCRKYNGDKNGTA